MSALALSVSLALSLRVLRHRLFGVFERPCLPRMHVVDEEAFYSCMHVVDEEALLLVPSESSPNAVCISLMPSAAVRVSSRLCVRVVYVCVVCVCVCECVSVCVCVCVVCLSVCLPVLYVRAEFK
jgi:hypothetical protein